MKMAFVVSAFLGTSLFAQAAPAVGTVLACLPDTSSRRDTAAAYLFGYVMPTPAVATQPQSAMLTGLVPRPVEADPARVAALRLFASRFDPLPSAVVTDIMPDTASAALPGSMKRRSAPYGELRFTLRADGLVSDVHLAAASGDARLDAALLHAAARMDTSGAAYRKASASDTLQMRIYLAFNGSAGGASMPLTPVNLITYTETPLKVKPGNPQPRYPSGLEAVGENGEVILHFIVDEEGRPRMNTVHVERGVQRGLVQAALVVLADWRFTPATVGGCPVRQWAELPVIFRQR